MSEESSRLQELLQDARDGGEPVDEGTFTIDEAQTREKLRERRLGEPDRWILSAIRAASWGGASRVEYEGGNDSEIRLYGLELTNEELEHLFVHSLADVYGMQGDERRRAGMLRALAVAVDACVETDARRVTLESRSQQRRRLELRPGGETAVPPPTADASEEHHVRIHVERGGIGMSRSRREVELLEHDARFARFPIRIEDRPMPRLLGDRLADTPSHPTESFEDPVLGLSGFCARLGVSHQQYAGQVLFVSHDVLLARSALDHPEFVAVVHGEYASDLSDAEMREDERSSRARELANEALRIAAPRAKGPAVQDTFGKKERELGIALVFGLAAMVVLAIAGSIRSCTQAPKSPPLDITHCRDDASHCVEVGDAYLGCAEGNRGSCPGPTSARQARVLARDAYDIACRAELVEGCRRAAALASNRRHPGLYEPAAELAARRKACELGTANDCFQLAARFQSTCANEGRCQEIVRVVDRGCTLGERVDCEPLDRLRELFEADRAWAKKNLTGDAQSRQMVNIKAALELLAELERARAGEHERTR